jgi:hypothetical protein
LRKGERIINPRLPTVRWHRCGRPARRADRGGRRARAGPRHSLRRQPQPPSCRIGRALRRTDGPL